MSRQRLSALDWACGVTAEPLQSKIVMGKKPCKAQRLKPVNWKRLPQQNSTAWHTHRASS